MENKKRVYVMEDGYLVPKEEPKQDAIEYSLNAFKVPKEYFGKEKIKIQCKDCNTSLEDCTCIEDTIDMKQETLEELKDLAYYKANAEEDYLAVPISVLRYISQLEQQGYSKEEVKLAFIEGHNKMKQETLEEAIKRLYGVSYEAITREQRIMRTCKLESFKEGAKWQQENRYSEEEVIELLYKRDLYMLNRDESLELELTEEWFEKNKKK